MISTIFMIFVAYKTSCWKIHKIFARKPQKNGECLYLWVHSSRNNLVEKLGPIFWGTRVKKIGLIHRWDSISLDAEVNIDLVCEEVVLPHLCFVYQIQKQKKSKCICGDFSTKLNYRNRMWSDPGVFRGSDPDPGFSWRSDPDPVFFFKVNRDPLPMPWFILMANQLFWLWQKRK